MEMENKNNWKWELLGYVGLVLCVVGQITVGYWYLVAQCVYLVANVTSIIRDFALSLPNANKVKDVVFTGITIGLIVIYLV